MLIKIRTINIIIMNVHLFHHWQLASDKFVEFLRCFYYEK